MSLTDIKNLWVIYRQTIRMILAVLFLIVLIGITIWLFFFNKGVLTVVAKPPFNVLVSGVINKDCKSNECSLELATGDYDVIVSKPDHENIKFEIKIVRAGEIRKDLHFKFIPQITSVGNWWTEKLYEKYIHQFQQASLFEEDIKDKDIAKFFESYGGKDFAWIAKTKNFIFLKNEDQTLKQGIYLADINFENLKRITIFPREIENSLLAVSSDGKQLTIVDLSKNLNQVYLIGLNNGNKEKIYEAKSITSIRWLGTNNILLERIKEGGEIALELINIKSALKANELAFSADLPNISIMKSGEILFFNGRKLNLDSQKSTSDFWLNSYDPRTKSITKLINLKDKLLFFPEKIEISVDEKTLRVLSHKKLYDIRLQN